jgi:DNA-binding helix-hairpin-helix protein with protein kinase domain
MDVPGFGRHLKSLLLNWRQQCEARFRFNPAGPLPQKQLHELDLRMGELRRCLELELRAGPQSLSEISVIAERKLRECEARTASLVLKGIQAEADLAICF